jgi:hypothetical protein
MNSRLKLLRDATSILAASANVQLDRPEKLGVPGNIHELALQFDDAASASEQMRRDGELSNEAVAAITDLENLLSRMSVAAQSHLWTPNALASSREWFEVRQRSQE